MNKENILKPSYWLSKTKKVIKSAFNRFPLTITFFIAIAILLIYEVNTPYNLLREHRDVLNRIYGGLGIGISLSMAVKVLLERLDKGKKEGFIAGIGVILITILYYIFLLPEYNTITSIRLGFTIIALLLAFIFIPYLKREKFELYVVELITKTATTFFFSIVLGLGVTALVFAIESLLIETLSSNFYAYTWIITGFIFAPTYFFYALPKHNQELSINDYAKPIKIALIYLVLPLLSAYTLVLYLYFARIIITWDWPSGIVSYLVSSYAAIGIIAVFLSWPFRDNKWVATFIKVYTKVVFPLLIMMFIAIYLRINQHGVTENRYFIVAIGLWATFAMIFINLDKGKRNIILVASLALTLVITSYGPISASNLTIRSQNNRFEQLLIDNSMLEGNTIVPNSNIPGPDKRSIISIIELFQYNYGFERLDYIPTDFDLNQTEVTLGFERYNSYQPDKKYFHYFVEIEALNISEYDLFIPLRYYRGREDYLSNLITVDGDMYQIKVLENVLYILRNSDILLEIYLEDQASLLYETYGGNNEKESQDLNDLIFIYENDTVKVKTLYQSFYGSYTSDKTTIEEISIEGYVLIKIK